MNIKRGLCISGGGAKGAFGTGVIDYLSTKMYNKYSVIIGVSTGSLMMPLVALDSLVNNTDSVERLKTYYTSVENKDIWKFNPFNKNGSTNYIKALYREILGKSWGDIGNLRNLIYRWFSKEEFNTIRSSSVEIIACCVDMTNGRKLYISSKDVDYEIFVDAMMASSSVPVYSSPVIINGYECLDGGVLEVTALQKAIDMGCTHIDVIVHRPKEFHNTGWKSKGGLSHLERTLEVMNFEISEGDLVTDSKHKIVINYIFTPYNLTDNSLIFNKDDMIEWQKLGYQTAESIIGLDKEIVSKCFKRVNIKATK